VVLVGLWTAVPTRLSGASDELVDQSAARSGLIAGRVVDADGGPVSGAVVMVQRANVEPGPGRVPGAGGQVPVRVDDRGRFVVSNVPAGAYRIGAARTGWLPGSYGRRRPGGSDLTIDLGEGQTRNDLVITVWRPAVIAGTVTDDNGDPLVGVEVRAIRQVFVAGRRRPDSPDPPQSLPRQKTDDNGAYRFPDLVPGDYTIAVLSTVLSEPPGFAGAARANRGTPRAYYQTMTGLGAAPMLFERATGSTGPERPLLGALTNLPSMPDGDAPWSVYPTTFHPSATTQSAAGVVPVASGEVRTSVDVSVRLTRSWQVSGELRDNEGPAAWHAVHLVPADAGATPVVDVGTAVTNTDGIFSFYGVPPGQYIARVVRVPWPVGAGQDMGIAGGTGQIPRIAVFSRGPSSEPPQVPSEPLMYVDQPVTVSDGHVRNIALTMREGPRVSGRVVFEGDAGNPTPEQMAQARVTMQSVDGSVDGVTGPSPIESNGQSTTAGLWPGRYVVRVNPPAGWTVKEVRYQDRDLSETAVDLTRDLTDVVIAFTDRAASLAGTVQAERDLRPEDVAVLLFPTDSTGWVDYGPDSRRITSARVTAAGSFSFASPPDGDYYLVAIAEVQADEWQNPATLRRLAALAEQIRVSSGESGLPVLRVQELR
jgi:protocatechuate 3,4-dioxygenase beta subunit